MTLSHCCSTDGLKPVVSPILVRAHELGRFVFRQSRLQELIDRPTLPLDEVRYQQPVARVEAIFDPHRDIDRPVAKRIAQLFERLAVLYGDIVGQSLPYPLRNVQAGETDMFPGNHMSEFVRAQSGQCARRSAYIPQMDDPAVVKVSAAQKGMTAKTRIPGEAPGVGGEDEEQAVSPAVVGHIEPVLTPLGFERRPVQQSFAVTKKPLSATGRNGTVRGDNELPRAERK